MLNVSNVCTHGCRGSEGLLLVEVFIVDALGKSSLSVERESVRESGVPLAHLVAHFL